MSQEKPVRSPCINVCCLGDKDICTGCQRSAAEITEWGRATNERRREILGLCEHRAREQGVWMNIGTVKG